MRQWIRSRLTAPTSVSIAAILVLAAASLVALSSASAARSRGPRAQRRAEAAQQVHCGDTITTDVTLHHNLVNCPNNGVIIGADNVTLDLNYHTIDGDGTPAVGCDPQKEFCDLGVADDGHDGVTVLHGSVREFLFGVALARTRHSRVLDLSSASNAWAGFFCGRCVRTLVRNSAGNRTKGTVDQAGMLFFQSHHDRILHSTFRGNAGTGILSPESTKNVIRGNLFSHNGAEGLFMEGSDGFRISRNRSVGNQVGIAFGSGSDNVITRNHVSHAHNGIAVPKGHGNLIARNVVAHTDNGIWLEANATSSGAHNVVRHNLVRGSRRDGFLVGKKDRHSRLTGNTAKRSGDDGFDVESRSATLTNNRAVRNNDLGIQAVRGVNDGGGNQARGNGDLRQCINIVCS